MRNVDGLYKKDFYNDILNTKHFCENVSLGYKEYDNATVLSYHVKENGKRGGGVETADGYYLENTGLHTRCNESYEVNNVTVSDDKVIYIGMFNGIWGHHLTDNLRRIWFLKTEIYKKEFGDYKVVYVAYPNFKLSGNHKELLEIMGIDCSNFIKVTEPMKFKKVIIPDESFFLNDECSEYYFTKEYRDLINCVREYGIKHKTELKFDKVYFTHSRYATLKEWGESKLERFFKKHGYKIIRPETLTFYEQLNILTQCKSFASTIGSGSHNMMFMQDGSEAILIPRSNYLTGYQVAIDEVADINVKYVDASMSIMTEKNLSWTGPFYFFVSKELAETFGDRVDIRKRKKDWRDFKTYVFIGKLLREELNNLDALEYYADALGCFAQERRDASWLNIVPKGRYMLSFFVKGLAYVINKCKGIMI